MAKYRKWQIAHRDIEYLDTFEHGQFSIRSWWALLIMSDILHLNQHKIPCGRTTIHPIVIILFIHVKPPQNGWLEFTHIFQWGFKELSQLSYLRLQVKATNEVEGPNFLSSGYKLKLPMRSQPRQFKGFTIDWALAICVLKSWRTGPSSYDTCHQEIKSITQPVGMLHGSGFLKSYIDTQPVISCKNICVKQKS